MHNHHHDQKYVYVLSFPSALPVLSLLCSSQLRRVNCGNKLGNGATSRIWPEEVKSTTRREQGGQIMEGLI